MRRLLIATFVTVGVAAGAPSAFAVGCISGGVVGGVAGHAAGHHGLLGAAAGCAVGHHMAVTRNRQAQQPQQQQPPATH